MKNIRLPGHPGCWEHHDRAECGEANAVLILVLLVEGETIARVYTNQKKAAGFAERQRKSPVVKMARVTQLS
jgi:hypothetical protein